MEMGLKAMLDSPDQGVKDIHVDTVIMNDANVRFEVKIITDTMKANIILTVI